MLVSGNKKSSHKWIIRDGLLDCFRQPTLRSKINKVQKENKRHKTNRLSRVRACVSLSLSLSLSLYTSIPQGMHGPHPPAADDERGAACVGVWECVHVTHSLSLCPPPPMSGPHPPAADDELGAALRGQVPQVLHPTCRGAACNRNQRKATFASGFIIL